MNKTIIPAIIPRSYAELEAFVAALGDVPEVHVDVVDKTFSNSPSWPREIADVPEDILPLLAPYTSEVDLMIENPVGAAKAFESLGADMVVFHVETITETELRSFLTHTKMSVGIAANNSTSFINLVPYLSLVDYVQVMGIATIGQQGQPFDETAQLRIAEIHTMFPHLAISIDGSMNADTIPRILSLPISRVVVGSAIMKSPAPRQAYDNLLALLSSTD